MTDQMAHLFWMLACASCFAYTFYLLFGSLFIVPQTPHVVIRDTLRAGEHTLSGMVMVSTPCDELTVHTTKLSPTTYTLELSTWEDPSVTCPRAETPRAFKAITFAPAFGVQFLVFFNGQTVPFDMTPVLPTKTR